MSLTVLTIPSLRAQNNLYYSFNYSLICEVQQLKDAIQALNDQLRRAEGVLQELLRLRTEKEGQLAVKNNSLFIDREKCLALRTQWPGGPTAGAANAIPCPGYNVSSVRACNCN